MAFRSSAKASSSSGGTITATPTGVQAHDYLGATYVVDSNSPTLSVPSGWTNDTSNFWGSGGPDGGLQFFAFKADATGTDAFGFSDTSGTASNSLITAAWSGRNNATPHSTARVKTVDGTSNASPISATITGITASANDDIAVWMATDQTVAAARWTFSPITGYTEQQDGVATDWVSGIALDTRDNVSAGATGSFATTITRASGTGNAGFGGIVVAIKAAAGGGTQSFSYTATGGLTFSGIADELRSRVTSAVGGLALAGSSTVARVAARAASGGINFAGSALVAFHESIRTVVASGGLSFSGSSIVNYFSSAAAGLLSRVVHLRRFIGRR